MRSADIADAVSSCADLLMSRQRKSSSWKSDDPCLDSVIITTQATLLLAQFRCGYYDAVIRSSCAWLIRPDVASSQYSYWRLLPLIHAGRDSCDVDAAWRHVYENVSNRVLHHPNSPIIPFFVYCSAILGKAERPEVSPHVDDIAAFLQQLNADASAETTSFRLIALALARPDTAREIMERAIDHIRAKAHFSDGRAHWANLVATAYITLNLIELRRNTNGSSIHSALDDLIAKATNFVFSECRAGHFDSQLLAGGEKEIDVRLYTRIVCARALAAYLHQEDPYWQQKHWAGRYRALRGRYRLVSTSALGLLVLLASRFIPHLPSVGRINWTTVSRSADVLAWLALAWAMCNWIYRSWKERNKGIERGR